MPVKIRFEAAANAVRGFIVLKKQHFERRPSTTKCGFSNISFELPGDGV